LSIRNRSVRRIQMGPVHVRILRVGLVIVRMGRILRRVRLVITLLLRISVRRVRRTRRQRNSLRIVLRVLLVRRHLSRGHHVLLGRPRRNRVGTWRHVRRDRVRLRHMRRRCRMVMHRGLIGRRRDVVLGRGHVRLRGSLRFGHLRLGSLLRDRRRRFLFGSFWDFVFRSAVRRRWLADRAWIVVGPRRLLVLLHGLHEIDFTPNEIKQDYKCCVNFYV
jgi:hypothetical protein